MKTWGVERHQREVNPPPPNKSSTDWVQYLFTLQIKIMNNFPEEVLQIILQMAAQDAALSCTSRHPDCLLVAYRKLAICRRWKRTLDTPFFHKTVREKIFETGW